MVRRKVSRNPRRELHSRLQGVRHHYTTNSLSPALLTTHAAISTFPYLKKKNQRECDPIADHFGLAAFHNRILGVIADGCGHGAKAHQASTRAVETAITNFTDTKTYLADLRVRQFSMLALCAVTNCHVHPLGCCS